jgi:single-strand DNA-binding protein
MNADRPETTFQLTGDNKSFRRLHMSLNKVLLIGNLGSDPEIRTTSSGQSVCNYSLATSRRWNNREGQAQEETEWHRIVVWGRQAETCKEFLSKGRQVFIEGRLQTRQWEDQNGNKKYTTEVVAQNVQFLSGGRGAGASGKAPDSSPQPEPSAFDSGDSGTSGEDDIPF